MEPHTARSTQALLKWRRLRTSVWIATLFSSGCIIGDGDERCGDNQRYIEPDGVESPARCECVEGAVPDPRGYGCERCGKNETVQGTMCVCKSGYARASEDGPCEQASIGMSCEGEADCQEPFPFCASDGEDRYCTSENCTATSCPTGFACENVDDSSACLKLPEALGKACTSNGDCTGANIVCDTAVTRTCILVGCATGDSKCPGFYGCCDLSMLMPNFSICVSPMELTPQGGCMFGTLVMP